MRKTCGTNKTKIRSNNLLILTLRMNIACMYISIFSESKVGYVVQHMFFEAPKPNYCSG